MSGRNSTEADDVLDFLDSLPERKKKDIKNVKKEAKTSTQDPKNDTEILDFLDELEQSNLSLNREKKTVSEEPIFKDKEAKDPKTPQLDKNQGNVENDKQEVSVPASSAPKTPATPKADPVTETNVEEKKEDSKPTEQEEEEEPLHDPITSISNWWSSSGSATVNSFFSKTAEQASHLKDRIAHEQQGITSRLQTTSIASKINSSTISMLAKNLSRIVVGEADEVLRIHLVHDLVNYPLLSYHVEQQFDSVLSSQVQGGVRIFVDEWDHPTEGQDRVQDGKRHLNMFTGKIADGEKLAFANLNNAIKLFTKAKEELAKQRTETEHVEDDSAQEQSISDVFISILPIAVPTKAKSSEITTTDPTAPGNFAFTIALKDIRNDFTSITRSQGFPQRWAEWLEGTSELKSKQDAIQDRESKKDTGERTESSEIVEDVDASEWVKEWVEDGLSLSFGVVAQNYVIDRMGF
ncbi:LAME_0G05534g1_1 [Lachancea meyersii CBS 8951]|uniref:LAME_0G05534g1_1 n=1 Tax=Lachancea meyersii CBS 8951 TaxID=1266667 RepID=A0A1G4K785_9SACH|nr:LAME_0G05534g1_1 [Lachancea meyersii CBS 8951]